IGIPSNSAPSGPFHGSITELLTKAVEVGASDLHLVIGKTPMARVRGDIRPLDPAFGVLTAEESKRLIYDILHPDQRQRLDDHWELDFSFTVADISRFRVNVLKQRTGT